jgi:hypothetical protein
MSRPWSRGAAAARREAQVLWRQQEKSRDVKARKEREKEQEALALKTAHLRALRLAKEAADREIAAKEAAARPPGGTRRRLKSIAKKPESLEST